MDLGVITIKGYYTLSRSPELEPHYEMQDPPTLQRIKSVYYCKPPPTEWTPFESDNLGMWTGWHSDKWKKLQQVKSVDLDKLPRKWVYIFLVTSLTQQHIYILNIRFYHSLSPWRCPWCIVVGNGHGDTSSNPGRDWLHFT